MQRIGFLKQNLQKNNDTDLRKLSLQCVLGNARDKQKGIVLIEPPTYNSQMPAFINRKVKNLKPYTNHFKRFNVQATKIHQLGSKNNDAAKIKVSLQNDKFKMAKSGVLKELGIQKQIKPFDSSHKVSQISVYDQFLQKTSNMFSSNVIESMYQQCIKKSQKYTKQSYQRSHRVRNSKQVKQNLRQGSIQRQQRRSIGGGGVQANAIDLKDGKKSMKVIRSMDQLIKTEQGVIKNDRVCILPNFLNVINDDLTLNEGIKYVGALKKKKSTLQTAQSVKKMNSHKINSKQTYQSNPSNQKKLSILQNDTQTEDSSIKSNNYNNNDPPISPTKCSIESQLSPTSIVKNTFCLQVNFHKKQQKKIFQNQQLSFKKSQKEVTTINVDKNKIKNYQTDVPLPTNVTACSYIVYEPSFSRNQNFNYSNQENLAYTNKVFTNQRIMAAFNCKTVVQIASLTKIMTFILALQICQNFKIDSTVQKVRIGKFQSNINGTSAEIKQGQFYTVQQLYYGLMLPSGNDASLALATWGGKKMLVHEIKQKQKNKKKTIASNLTPKNNLENESIETQGHSQNHKIVLKKKKCYQRFILQMNKKARNLGMTKTTYANSHGLSNNLNKSCAFDLCILCQYAMLNEKFKKVVSTKKYESKILYEDIQQQEHPEQNQREQKQDGQHPKIEEQNDDIQHQNQHSDEQSSEQIQQKQSLSRFNPFSQRSKRFINSQTSFSINRSDKNSISQPVSYKQKQIIWQNTHKLLSREDYIGIKTGITNTAGPCLASCIKTVKNRCFIIIVLNSKKINYRFKDTEILRKWIYKRQGIVPAKLKKSDSKASFQYEKNEADEETLQNSQNLTYETENLP